VVRSNKGFTLLEVLIVLMIMAALTVLSSQSIQQGIASKIKIQTTNDQMSQVRDALKIIEKDINLIMHYQDIEVEMFELIKKKKLQLSKPSSSVPGQPVVNPNAPYPCPEGTADPLCLKKTNRISPVTGFLGKEDEIAFVTLNTSRVTEGASQADFVKVGYSVRGCKRPGKESGSSNCLLRREALVAEGEVGKGGEEVILLDGIEEFKLRYYGIGKQDWSNDWAFNIKDPKAKFPDAVEISLTVAQGEKERKKKVSMQIVVPIRFVNNPEEKATQ
jgi:prepilin-type N-terminal cleavage/methylation domain-containing protein